MSAISDNQVNFNPTWMQSPPRGERPGLHRVSAESDDSKDMIAPVFAEHRYGREDILALQPQGTKPPDGLLQCPFVVMEGQGPIILMAPTEAEQRLSSNINSSKALSLVNHQERMNGGGTSNGSHWVTAGGSGRGSKTPGNRWSALSNNDSPTGGLHYVKPGLGRGGATLGRGGGTVGFTTGRGGHRGGFEHKTVAGGDRTRSRLKSSSEEEGPGGWTVVGGKQETGSVWKNTNSRNEVDENNFNRGRGNGLGQIKHGIGRFPSNNERFFPDFKRSESHEPTENWSTEERKAPERQLSSPPVPIDNFGQYSPPIKPTQSTAINDDLPKPEEALMSLQLDNPDSDSYHSFIHTLAPAEFESWFYLDPENKQHGPYEAPQMLIWYKSKFFSDELRCRRVSDAGFTTLGQLIKVNGSHDPFLSIRKTSQPLPPPQPPIIPNTWQNTDYLESQRIIMEERRRLAEEQERIRRDDEERMAKEHRLRLMEEEIERRKEELHRVARAKEEEFERKRYELMEMERQRQEADRLLAEQREREAMEVRRIQEERERERQHLEAQQRAAEDLIRREKEKAEQEAARLREQAIMEARRLAAEEAEKQKMILLQEQRAKEEQLRLERVKQLAEATKQREAEEAAAHAKAAAAAREAARAAAAKSAPWVAKDKTPQLQTQRSLLEIQLEEEKKLQEQRKKEQEMVEQQKKQQKTVTAAGPWANSSSAKGPWSSPVGGSKNAAVRDTAWPAIPVVAAPAPVVKKEAPKTQVKEQKQPVKTAKPQEKKKDNGSDEFRKWALKAVAQLNKSVGGNVEAEPFVAFIEGIENPDEIEDYFLSYFGESTSVKEFHRVFLEKRIELRPRAKTITKDDLSTAQAAVTGASNPLTTQSAGKKKKTKAAKTIDLTTLGFKPAGNPNRINAGEIDVPAPVSPPRRKR